MSEEEIIDEIKYNILNDPFIVFSQDSSFEDVQIKANAIQGLLDLYNEEKEKADKQQKEIEELKKYMKTNLIPKSTINLLYISKDKIREKIEELEENIKKKRQLNIKEWVGFEENEIEILEELLGEDND